jgi:hypothetical protein
VRKKKRTDSFVSIVLYIILRQRTVGLWIRVLVFNATYQLRHIYTPYTGAAGMVLHIN